MTSLTSQRRRLRQIEDRRRDLLSTAGNEAQARDHRFHIGMPTDDDIDDFALQVSSLIFFELDQAFANDGRSRDEQLAAAPAARLALDAAYCGEDRAALHEALQALRRLAATGDYSTAKGWRRATPPQRSHARVLLRRLIRMVVWNDAQASSATVNGDTETDS